MKKITKVIVAGAIAVAVLGGVSVIKYANTDRPAEGMPEGDRWL